MASGPHGRQRAVARHPPATRTCPSTTRASRQSRSSCRRRGGFACGRRATLPSRVARPGSTPRRPQCVRARPGRRAPRRPGGRRGHLLTSDLAALPLTSVTSGRVETLLQAKNAELAPQTVNHLRAYPEPRVRSGAARGALRGSEPSRRRPETAPAAAQARLLARPRGRPAPRRAGPALAAAVRGRDLHRARKG